MGSRSNRTPLRVLCIGNSLTGGYPSTHPYGGRLAQKLRAAFPTHDVTMQVDGVPGDMVTRASYKERMLHRWRVQGPRGGYDWTIVLGGTNDLAWGRPADEVLTALEEIWSIPLSKRGKVLALTVPEIKMEDARLDERRNAVNSGIKSYRKQNFYTFDLHQAVPCRSMSEEDQKKFWEPDGVHLTEAGYDLMGEKIADGLIRILHLEEAQSTEISTIVTDARQRKLIEEMIFEEEQGSPKLLSQGWIVVRKRDLD